MCTSAKTLEVKGIAPNNSPRMYISVLLSALCNLFLILCSDGEPYLVLTGVAVGISVWDLVREKLYFLFV